MSIYLDSRRRPSYNLLVLQLNQRSCPRRIPAIALQTSNGDPIPKSTTTPPLLFVITLTDAFL